MVIASELALPGWLAGLHVDGASYLCFIASIGSSARPLFEPLTRTFLQTRCLFQDWNGEIHGQLSYPEPSTAPPPEESLGGTGPATVAPLSWSSWFYQLLAGTPLQSEIAADEEAVTEDMKAAETEKDTRHWVTRRIDAGSLLALSVPSYGARWPLDPGES